MAITSLDSIYNAIGSGSSEDYIWQKLTSNAGASSAGRWHELFTANGVPTAGSFSGTAGVATQLTRTSTGALQVGADVSPSKRHLINAYAQSPTATAVPSTLWLMDFLLYYPSCVVTGTATTLNNTATLPRYTTGEGVVAMVAVQTALGAASPALTLTYTDEAGNTGNTATAITSPGNSAPISTLFQTSAGGPFLQLAGTDKGVRKIDSYTLASGTTGTAAFILAKPLMQIPLGAINTPTLINAVHEFPSMPQIQDGACLGFVMSAGGAMAASSSIIGAAKAIYG